MKKLLCTLVGLISLLSVQSQNTDLPSPVSNNQTLPSGSYVVAMDNSNQQNNAGLFNYKAYGFIVTLLNNNFKVKWVITAGKAKDATDISVNATRIKPTAGSAALYNFKAGPFVIFASDTMGFAAVIDNYNLGISNTNDKVKVYKTNASATVDVRYDLTGFIPKIAVLNDGANATIHTGFLSTCGVPSGNYQVVNASDLLIKCFTFASEPHNAKTGQTIDDAIAAVKRFTQYGGNFLAECMAVWTYENNSNGKFLTTTGITDANSNAGTNITYPNPDLAYNQYEGSFDISAAGSFRNWRMNAGWQNNGHKHSKANSDTTVMGSSAAKMRSGTGGMVFYLGSHTFGTTSTADINGIRMYMNAVLTPAGLGNDCTINTTYTYPLAVKLTSFQGNLHNEMINLKWMVATNETVSKFTIEKSTDGINFSSLADIGSSFKNGEENYSYADPMKTEKVFYRLKISERSNFTSYSKVLIFQESAKSTDKVRVINNPVIDDKLSFEFSSNTGQSIQVQVIDMSGRVQFRKTMNANEGTNVASILLPSAMQDGLYVLDIVSGNLHSTAKFIKQ
jgi:hypothetical protein